MSFTTKCIVPVILILSVQYISIAQPGQPFDLTAYKQFLSTHQNMSADDLRSLYPAGSFTAAAPASFGTSVYGDSIATLYDLTDYERSLIETHGFMVTERLSRNSFGDAFAEIFHKDLPVFVSADAILHALHMSYDAMLRVTEEQILIPKLEQILSAIHAQLPALAARYASSPGMDQKLKDVDLFITVSRKLLGAVVSPYFSDNIGRVDELMVLIAAEKPAGYPLFSSVARNIDFSQFTVRGHYTQTEQLQKYFRAMMWLGRIEMYLIAPVNSVPPEDDENIQRQTIDAVLVSEAVRRAGVESFIGEMEEILRYFVGESDNVTLSNLETMLMLTGVDSASTLLEADRFAAFQDTLQVQSYAFQRILSQIIMSDPANPDDIRPASAFLLFGQRFIIDSYITGNVVYDKITYEQNKVWRALPSRYDVLFSLGNDATAQLLEQELSTNHYATNLASLRYLVDSYESEYWNSTLYTGWLNSIRSLNPPANRTVLPAFMQTAAWWQQKMNTQLASWAQLRHDNLLYAKQSYTGGFICSFPESYVEPIPEFYSSVKMLAAIAVQKFDSLSLDFNGMINYWRNLQSVADTLHSIALKELSGSSLTEMEKGFLRRMLFLNGICGPLYSGWYYHLYYTGDGGFFKNDMVVADIHTCPTDASGAPVGWVMHAGTGPVNLAVVTTEAPDGRTISYIGPVMSYYEHVSTNFKRLTDEEWQTQYLISPSFRPDFVNLYLADSLGNSRGEGSSLITGIDQNPIRKTIPATPVLGRNYPNPFNASTIISFSIPQSAGYSMVELAVYDVQGRMIRQLLRRKLSEGNYAVRWDAVMENGMPAPSGTYFYHLRVGDHRRAGKMSLVK
ncbi:MAG: DUF3160 domain-containing protein [Bacteroidota bacterium]